MFVVPDFMAPAFSCVMARRWRTGGVGVRPLAAGSRSPPRQELGGRGGAAAAVAAAGVGGRGGERGVVIRHRRAASTRRERRVVAGGVVSKARGHRGIPITASDGRHLRLCAPRQSAASSTQTPASRLAACTQCPSSASVVPATALPLIRRCSGHVTTLSVCTAQAVAVVLNMRDADTMQATAAANKGSTRVLYLSCDGSLCRGGSALVALCRRSIIPRVYRCCFWLPLASTDAVFGFPSPVRVWQGCSVEVDALSRLGTKE